MGACCFFMIHLTTFCSESSSCLHNWYWNCLFSTHLWSHYIKSTSRLLSRLELHVISNNVYARVSEERLLIRSINYSSFCYSSWLNVSLLVSTQIKKTDQWWRWFSRTKAVLCESDIFCFEKLVSIADIIKKFMKDMGSI